VCSEKENHGLALKKLSNKHQSKTKKEKKMIFFERGGNPRQKIHESTKTTPGANDRARSTEK